MRHILLTLLLSLSAGSVAAAPFAYSVNSNGVNATTSDSLYKIDLADGSATRINKVRPNEKNINSDIEGLAFAASGVLYAVDDADESLLTIDTASALGTPVNGNPFNLQLTSGKNYDFGLTFTCTGALLMASDDNQTLYRLDENLGNATPIGAGSALGAPITALAAWGNKVYGLGQGSSNNQALAPNLYQIDVSTGTTTLVGPLGRAAKLYVNGGLAFDDQGVLWAVTDRFNINNQDYPSQILQINPDTGKAKAIAEIPVIGLESLAITGPLGCSVTANPGEQHPIPIPVLNPLSILLMALVLLFVGGFNIRFKAG